MTILRTCGYIDNMHIVHQKQIDLRKWARTNFDVEPKDTFLHIMFHKIENAVHSSMVFEMNNKLLVNVIMHMLHNINLINIKY